MRIIGGKNRGRKLYTPQDEATRPTSDRVREALFNILENSYHLDFPTLSVLDLFSGTGALGVEALSRGAKEATFIENHKGALHIIEKNTAPFENAHVLKEDATTFSLPTLPPFDLVFMDPPYNKNLIQKTLLHLSHNGYIHPRTHIVCELGKNEEISLPDMYRISKNKIYGRTKIIFIQYKSAE